MKETDTAVDPRLHIKDNVVTLLHFIKDQGIKPEVYLHCTAASLKKILAGKQMPTLFMDYRLEKSFANLSFRAVKKGKEELPADKNYGFQRRTEKIRYLDKYLKDKAGLTLARAVSISLHKWNNLASGYSLPTTHLLKRIAVYFCLPSKMLLDDKVDLPSFEELKIDDDLASIQRNDLTETMNYYKNKHYLARNYRVLSHPMRVKLYLSLFLILIPLTAFTGYSTYRILSNRQESLDKFSDNSIDSTSQKFKDSYIANHTKDATNSASLTYCDVNMGVQVQKIYDIKPSNEYFSVALKVWFDFSQDDFHVMYKNFKSDDTLDATPNHITAYTYSQDMDRLSVSSDDNSVTYASDSIPDYLELATPFDLMKLIDDGIKGKSDPSEIQEIAHEVITNNERYTKLRNNWINERLSYPGLTPSSIYKDYDPNFDVDKGIDADSLRYFYAPGEAYYLAKNADGTGEKQYRMFQCLKFTAKVSKSYDNPRYPLETAQFWINIEPSDWLNVNNLRYVAKDTIDVSRKQNSQTTGYNYCSIDEPVYSTDSESIAFTDGFRSINNSSYKATNEMIEYNVNQEYPSLSHTKYTVVVRANRAAFTASNFLPSTFLTSYINLFAVIIWITIAFYNQSYAGEDSLGMLGTGMFSAISATIVGFQMVSDASMFSLLTMINIFTLAVILIMTYQAVMAKRARSKNDKALIAYNGVKLRIMFYILTICTLIMFIGLPVASYIWTV